MGYVITRVFKVVLTVVSDTYIDYKKDPEKRDSYFAYIDKKDFKKDHYENLMKKLRQAIRYNTPINLVLERRPGPFNKKQLMDYVIEAEFY